MIYKNILIVLAPLVAIFFAGCVEQPAQTLTAAIPSPEASGNSEITLQEITPQIATLTQAPTSATVRNQRYATTELETADSAPAPSAAPSPPDAGLWQRIADGLKLHPSIKHARVQKQLKIYTGNQRYFDAIAPKMGLHARLVVNEIAKQGAPMELALVPLIESGYRPTARADRGRIAGLWQFTSATGDTLGLERNEWYDARLDVKESTTKAVAYLTSLSEHYNGDWLLAIAAYNCGAGAIDQALRNNRRQGKKLDFWSLDLDGRSRDYVPKLLALAEIARHPDQYGIQMPELADAPSVEAIMVKQPIKLSQVAHFAGVDVDTIRELNPAYLRGITPASGSSRLVLPVGSKAEFKLALVKQTRNPLRQSRQYWEYEVKPGDTLGSIALNHQVTLADIRSENQLNRDFLAVGKILNIPVKPTSKSLL